MSQHALRGIGRVLALFAADATAFVLSRTILSLLRDVSWLERLADMTGWRGASSSIYSEWEMAVALLVGLVVAGAYHSGDAWRSPRHILSGVTLAVSLMLWNDMWIRGLLPVLFYAAPAIVGLGVTTLFARVALERLSIPLRHLIQTRERVLLLGNPDDPASQKVFERLSHLDTMEVLGWVTLQPTPASAPAQKGVLGSLEDLWKVMQGQSVDTVVLSGYVGDAQLQTLMEAVVSGGGRLLAVSRYERMGWIRPSEVSYHPISFMELTVPSLRGQQLWVKRAVDLLGAGMGLLAISPLLGFLALLIKLDSRGPVFFAQERAGLGGRTFRMLKFRTMRVGADAEKAHLAHLNASGDARLFKIPNDPRVTRVGTFLRKWSLDELPQLWNVFIGEMSLVGPRPFFEADLATYREHHFGRLGARPGITGLWQVSGRSSITDFEEVVRLDTEYIHRWSLWLDLEILLKTVPAVLRRSGAY
ncbi:sugar transferase [Hyalangium rubrum]|uniref:Sugar transferase n=1 Tax=Hyalangium rubrum TaxID=3103134 RepID=A0ABU5H7B3_9BACT|nr:sugar transferase [Hyalangium sp. s54d21]MDY7228642.1 sugar transferase [Hyalangium sp. s54d21]